MENKKADLLRQLADKNDELAALVASRDEAIREDKKDRDQSIVFYLKVFGIIFLFFFIMNLIALYACDDITFKPLSFLLFSAFMALCIACPSYPHTHEKELDKQIVKAHTDIANLTRELERLDRTGK